MPRRGDLVWDWLTMEALDDILFLLEWGRDADPTFCNRYRDSIVRWMQLDAENRPGKVRVGFFPRDYATFWTRIHDMGLQAAAEFRELDARYDDIRRKDGARKRHYEELKRRSKNPFLTKRKKGEMLAKLKEVEVQTNQIANELERLKERYALFATYINGSRVKSAIEEHKTLVEEHRRRKEKDRADRDARWYALIAAELMEDPDITGAEISRRHGIPKGDVYRLWKPLKQEAANHAANQVCSPHMRG